MRAPAAAALVFALALLVGCGGGEDVVETEGAAATGATGATGAVETTTELPQRCENPQGGYSVGYPDEWHTNPGDVAEPCAFFHPEPFEVPEATEPAGIAISIGRDPVAFDDVAGEDLATRILERERVSIDGRRAVRREIEATGEGLHPAGVRGYQYLVDLDGETIIMSTYEVDGLDYARNRAVLDAIAPTLRID